MTLRSSADLPQWNEGAPLPEVRLTPTTQQVRRFLRATGFGIPIFFDEQAARETGLRGPIVPAEMKSGFLISYLRRLAQPDGELVHLQSAFRRPDYHGDQITIGGQITRIEATEASKEIHLELGITQSNSYHSVRSSAVLRVALTGA